MQSRLRRFITLLLSLAVAEACADAPTSPIRSAEESRASEHVMYPGQPGQCDPWLDINWCEGDPGDGQCMSSDSSTAEPEEYVGVQGCTGGPGGLGGGGDPPPDG